MKRAVKIKQRDITDCGAACLASVAAYHQLKLPVARIRQLASTDKRGTNVLGMLEAANQLGFDAKGVRGPMTSLAKIPKPAIAHVVVQDVLHHFVVIYDVLATEVEVMDPADGQAHRYSYEAFEKMWTGVLILLWPNEKFEIGNKTESVLARFWQLVFPHRAVLIQVLFGALVYTVLGLAMSVYVQKIVDYVLIDGNRHLLNLMSVVMVILLLVQIFIGAAKSIFTLQTGQWMDAQLILGYYKHLLKLPQTFFDTMRTGEIISRINDAVKIRAFINDTAVNMVVSVFVVLMSFVLMFTYYWKLALVILLVVPLYAFIYFVTNRINKRVERRMMENAASLESQLVESLNTMYTMKTFGLETFTNLKTETRFIGLLRTVYQSGRNQIFSSSFTELFSRLFTIILLWIGAGFVLDSEITPGELLSFYALIGYFTGPISGLIGMNKVVQNAMIAADRLFEIMDLEVEEEGHRIKLTRDQLGSIVFKDVSFRYGTRAQIFQNLNLVIPQGKVTAIVGESGAGKSTLMAMIQQLYPLQSGSIFIGDFNLRYVDHESLRNVLGVVPQHVDLFAGNVVDNIAVGDFEPDMKKIIHICTSLGMMSFIEKLPQQFNTYLGENGATLSGGQKQRMAIARALYKDPEILLFDEATAALDSSSEGYVQEFIRQQRGQHKTILLIAHRLSTVCRADKIVVLSQGAVVEEGSHDDLLKLQQHYYRLWQQQVPTI